MPQYARPNLPYGPNDQEPWYHSRVFEATDFQMEQSSFEMNRQETENMRQAGSLVERDGYTDDREDTFYRASELPF
jgi:hypothetical protein